MSNRHADPAAKDALAERFMPLLLATACGMIVANLYYAQPLTGLIASELHMPLQSAGLVVTLTQIGYGLGLLLVVPMGDLIENRRLVLWLLVIAALALVAASIATGPTLFLAAAFVIGLGSVAVQVLVPYAAHMSHESVRGKAVGNVMSGLMFGIVLARPVSSFLTSLGSWHTIFYASAAAMLVLTLVLRAALPARHPRATIGYGKLMTSMVRIAATTPVLQRRALYHAAAFAAFSLFWTVTPLLLSRAPFNLTQTGIALFALAGAAGVVAAPIAGRIADCGWGRIATGFALTGVAAAFLITLVVDPSSKLALPLLVAAGVLLDFSVTTNLVLGQRAIFHLPAEIRSRLNGLYMATFFFGGAFGSAFGAWVFAASGWRGAVEVGVGLPALAFLYYLTEYRKTLNVAL